MIGKKIQKFVIKEIEAFCDAYKLQKAENGEGITEDQIEILNDLIKHFSMESKKTKKETPEAERCIAITSKKTQCTSKKVENDLCKLHFTKGTKYGVIGDDDLANDDVVEEKPLQNTCQYMYKKGKLASQLCNKKTKDGEIFCKKHTPSKTMEYIEKDDYVSGHSDYHEEPLNPMNLEELDEDNSDDD